MTDNIDNTLQQRKKILEGEEKILDNTIKNAQQMGEKVRNIVFDLERTKEEVNKNKDINEILLKHPQNFPKLYVETSLLLDQDKRFYTVLENYNSQIAQVNINLSFTEASGNTLPFLAASSTSGAVYTVSFLNDPAIKKELEGVNKNIFNNIDHIKNELKNLIPDRSNDFDSIIKDWLSINDPDLKYKSLATLRNTIFYQIFDTHCPQSDYSKTPWYKSTTNTRLRVNQTKYFILGYRDENTIPFFSKYQIDKLSTDMQTIFDDLSQYGKYGYSGLSLDILFEKVITNFRIIIDLRKTFFKDKI